MIMLLGIVNNTPFSPPKQEIPSEPTVPNTSFSTAGQLPVEWELQKTVVQGWGWRGDAYQVLHQNPLCPLTRFPAGQLPVEWELQKVGDVGRGVEMENWVEPSRPRNDKEKLHDLIIRERLLQIQPSEGSLQPGQSTTCMLTYRFVSFCCLPSSWAIACSKVYICQHYFCFTEKKSTRYGGMFFEKKRLPTSMLV